jgi:hypothetical protein
MNSCGLNWLTRVFLLMNLLEAKVLWNKFDIRGEVTRQLLDIWKTQAVIDGGSTGDEAVDELVQIVQETYRALGGWLKKHGYDTNL